jgi:prevent-host-death family protein
VRSVGVRELREHLSRVLGDVRAGEAVVITSNGQPVARLEPLQAGVPADVARLLATGRADWGGAHWSRSMQ